ncbi:ABC transporter permease subunit [Reinekea blandensis]|uniref:sn-glycerol-3-phosphate transport system permease protein UgpA n=1 Tax=Reinekea blandensis MED297 TaxID=314283 RepID=A4BHR9_9GAMM|nr:ABC transporter permease subunit [Reinekea blandensis]EAR08324.1 ABC-type sugar transport system, permease component [Reinekea sp. MED297] [Reinekea blandensis MED297]
MAKKVQFAHTWVPYVFIAPQLLIIGVFFFWPALQALYLSFMLEDPWGLSSTFVWFENYQTLFTSADYLSTTLFTLGYSFAVVVLSLGIALILAVKANAVLHGQKTYRLLLTWVYAVAPAVAGITAYFLFNRHIGVFYDAIVSTGWLFAPETSTFDATVLLILVSVWKQIPVNFVFFLAGLQSIPVTVREAAQMDCESPTRRFWTITFPLLAPTAFFLMVINITYAFFDTFGLIDTLTQGRPAGSTSTMVYKVYQDGFLGADLGLSSAQSVVLMILVMALVMVQFRFVERRIHY